MGRSVEEDNFVMLSSESYLFAAVSLLSYSCLLPLNLDSLLSPLACKTV